ncbi:CaiB/BaiF CoA-transferase family protein [Hydrogenophaga sp.]|uniref:CaiB/BaiF CoA transferase family protein n=2 Tax=unclassified Hydrogenophaga TaxID=2610897 RepID=UPI001ACA4F79|nr:CaiB/BaiF CoA-transferase family protein [Hydrogenophaga sp.]MBN9370645.1 CoA transferase [Hydrogenophaga sp.]
MKRLPLTGIRVLDLSRILAAPLAAQSLGDLGAEVIKIERPGRGDEARRWGPPFLKDRDGRDTRESPMYLSANRNKRSITIDLARPEGQDLVRRLVERSDVLIENYKVGDLQRYGLDYDSLQRVNPRLVYCSVTGFGQTGPYAAQPGYDTVFQAMSGLMSVTGLPDGVPGGGPMKTGPSLADFMAGQFATAGVLAALYERDTHSGEGAHIDIALLDSTIVAQTHSVATYLATGQVPPRRGTEGNGGLPSQAFACADRSVIVICGSEEQYRQFCEVLGHPELASDPRFATNSDRLRHRAELASTFGAITARWTSAELLAALKNAGIPSGPVNSYPEVFADPQVQHRGVALVAEHAQAGPTRFCGSPIRFTGVADRAPMAPPVLGQHTDELLLEVLGLDEAAIAALRGKAVL